MFQGRDIVKGRRFFPLVCSAIIVWTTPNPWAGQEPSAETVADTSTSERTYYRTTKRDSGADDFYRQDVDKRTSYFETNFGLVLGSGFGRALAEAYGGDHDVSGGGGAIDMGIGLGLLLRKNVVLIPRLHALVYRVKYETMPGFPSNDKFALLFLPGVSGRYVMGESRNAPYVSAELSLPSWTTDLDRLEVKPGGLAAGVAFGIIFGSEYEVEMGYLSAPCEVSGGSTWCYDSYCSKTEKTNLGGLSLSLRRRFGL